LVVTPPTSSSIHVVPIADDSSDRRPRFKLTRRNGEAAAAAAAGSPATTSVVSAAAAPVATVVRSTKQAIRPIIMHERETVRSGMKKFQTGTTGTSDQTGPSSPKR
ncbi:hypothetical protein PFISCL1PPCAC_21533, partial [Pristionchus fissidentatus]